MYYFYVLYSLKDHKLYKGISGDIGQRFIKHNMGGTRSTRNRRPLLLIYAKSFGEKSEALRFERYSKTPEGGRELKDRLMEFKILDSEGKL